LVQALRYKPEGRAVDPDSRAVAGISVSNPVGGVDVCVVCCTAKVKEQTGEKDRQTDNERIKMASLSCSFTQFFRPHCGPGVDSDSNRNEYQESFLGVKTAGA
jgi:hypothetical protein